MYRFVIRKYIFAKSAKEAIRKDKTTEVQDVYVDEDWKKLQDDVIRTNPVGFTQQ